MDNNSKSFKDLEKKWYAKLSSSGFKDIEQPDGNLRTWASSECKSYAHQGTREAKEEYYRLAGQFLHDYRFSNTTEKFIWRHHSNGISIRNIVSLFAAKGTKTNKRAVHETIQRLAKKMLSGVTNE